MARSNTLPSSAWISRCVQASVPWTKRNAFSPRSGQRPATRRNFRLAQNAAERPDWLAGGPGFEPRLTESGALSSAVELSLSIPGCCFRQFGTSTIDLRHLDAFNCLDLDWTYAANRASALGLGVSPDPAPPGDLRHLRGFDGDGGWLPSLAERRIR